jgi:type III secretory pathway component EscV
MVEVSAFRIDGMPGKQLIDSDMSAESATIMWIKRRVKHWSKPSDVLVPGFDGVEVRCREAVAGSLITVQSLSWD